MPQGNSRSKYTVLKDDSGSLLIPGTVCPENSTTTLLLANETFTGVGVDISYFAAIAILISSDVASTDDGLSVQFSPDNATWFVGEKYTVLAGSTKFFTPPAQAQYMRVVYTNNSLDQAEFTIHTMLKANAIKWSSHNIEDPIKGEDDAELVKAVITGRREDEIFGNVVLDNENNLRVNSLPYTYAISKDIIVGHDPMLKFGTRSLTASNTDSLVWEGSSPVYPYLTIAEQLKISSTSAQDGVGGTGALTLIIQGLDSNWNEISETITMTGLTVVTTVNSYLRVFRAYSGISGTSLTNVGVITINDNADVVEMLKINIGDGQTLMTMWTVPIGKVAYLLQGTLSTNGNKGVRVSLMTKLNDGGILYPWLIKYRAYIFEGNEVFPFNIPFKIPEKTDVEVRVLTPASAGTTSVGSTFELWYENV